MKIAIKDFNDIIEQVLKEQDFSIMKDSEKNELLKRLLLYTEYIAKYYTLIKGHIDSVQALPPADLQKSVVEFLKKLISDPEFVRLNDTVKQLVLKKLPEYSRVLAILSHSLDIFIKYINSYAKPSKDADGNDIPVDTIYASFLKDFNNYFNSITNILVKIRSKFSETATNKVETGAISPKIEVANLISDLEKIINAYLSEIELVFRKFDSIRIESGEYSKKWEEYNLLRGYNFHQRGLAVSTDPNFEKYPPEIRQKVEDYFKHKYKKSLYPEIPEKSEYKFKIPIFLNLLLTGKYKTPKAQKISPDLFPTDTYPLKETQKAASIDSSLKKIFGWNPSYNKENPNGRPSKDSLEGQIGDALKILHSKTWDTANQIYAHQEELKELMQILFNAKFLYKSSLNKIVSNIEKFKDGKLEDIFKVNGPILDAIIKYIQFAKLNVKNVYVKLISNSGVSIDVEKYQQLFSSQEDPVIAKRLAYWALFQRLGWTKGLKSQEAPDWIYGIKSGQPEETPNPGIAPGPGTSVTRRKFKIPKNRIQNNIASPTSSTTTPTTP